MQSQDRAGMARRGGGRGMRGVLGAVVACVAMLAVPAAASAATVAFGGGTVTTTYGEGNSGQVAVSLPYTVACGLAEFSNPSVDVVLTAGTATPNTDYTSDGAQTSAFSCVAGLGGGSASATTKITGDTLDEPDETFTVKLVDSANPATVFDSRTITITDDDAPPAISVGDAPAVIEGTGTAGPGLVFPVTLSGPSGKAISVPYATSDGSAAAGVDYTATSGTLTIPAGRMTGTITVPVAADAVDEDDEDVNLTLGTPTNATAGTTTAKGAITDDDTATITLSGAAILEGGAGTTTTTNAIVNLSTTSAKPVSVSYTTADGTATAGSDYTAAVGTATVPAGSRTVAIPVTITGDADVEPGETITVRIKDPVNAAIAPGGDTATITIRNDDVALTTTPLPGGILAGAKPGTGTPLPTTAPAVDAPITLSRLTFNRRRRTLRFDVRCPEAGGACKGTVTVFTVPNRRSKVKALRKEQQLASKRFSITAAGTLTASVRLSKKAKGWLRTARTIKVVAYAVASSPQGGVSTAKVKGTLRR
ncbi:hypothetical protein NBH00_14640 [Paraconexibacter antarcticus]|uniref:Calx-beta domain-containing protein n=1 Tax=Paraconexibacter antarcticus TaxID=2949664 RepID=A0ABY5DP76_9ACTN|nr:Calx-beta domain-containing protein [Paraconexibacter antarcticus]UTI62597.1 hypothetical protein NBH00_14640 [Paraconexibacter antarcticus]